MGYFERAVLEAVMIGAVCGLTGVVVVLRRRAFFTQALTHATFPGAVAAAALGVGVLVGAAVSSVALVIVMTLLGRIGRQGAQVASGVVLTAGFALGVLVQALVPSLPISVESYLVGSILTVSDVDVLAGGSALVVVLLCLLLFGKELLFATFDPNGYRAAGYRSWIIELVSLGMITLTVVVAMPAVGAILALALVAAPAATARLLCRTVGGMLIVAPSLGIVAGLGGLMLSRVWSVSAGAMIAMLAAGVFGVVLLGTAVLQRVRRRAIRWSVSSDVPKADASGAQEVAR